MTANLRKILHPILLQIKNRGRLAQSLADEIEWTTLASRTANVRARVCVVAVASQIRRQMDEFNRAWTTTTNCLPLSRQHHHSSIINQSK